MQLGRWRCFFLTSHRGADAGGEYGSVSRLGLLIGNRWISRLGDQILQIVLECASWSRDARTVGAAVSETVTTVSLSTVPRLSRQSCHLRVGKGTRGEGRAVWLTGLTRCAFTRDQMTPYLDDYDCSAEVRGSFQETAPRKTTENTAMAVLVRW